MWELFSSVYLTYLYDVISSGGISYSIDKVEIKVDGAPKCPRCDTSVYFNEEKKALGKTWHVRCFNCCKHISLITILIFFNSSVIFHKYGGGSDIYGE